MTLSIWATAAIVVAAVAWLAANSRGATPEAPNAVQLHDGRFEIRRYPALTVVKTKGDADNDAFRRLFGYISGENETRQKISMTTPVFMEEANGQRAMEFVPPQELQSHAPQPSSADVATARREGGRFAVLRFRGGRNRSNGDAALTELQAELKRRQLHTFGDPIFAFYDPPWVPTFLRRNEVMLRID